MLCVYVCARVCVCVCVCAQTRLLKSPTDRYRYANCILMREATLFYPATKTKTMALV